MNEMRERGRERSFCFSVHSSLNPKRPLGPTQKEPNQKKEKKRIKRVISGNVRELSGSAESVGGSGVGSVGSGLGSTPLPTDQGV
jgi:hypothetical protein